MSTAEDLAVVVASLRPLANDLALPVDYAVFRPTSTIDGAGGRTETETTVEAGKCRKRVGGVREGERVVMQRLQWSSGYALDLPMDTSLTPADDLTVNGVRLEVGEVQREGAFGIFATAIVRERG
jgi:hypothetical protein